MGSTSSGDYAGDLYQYDPTVEQDVIPQFIYLFGF